MQAFYPGQEGGRAVADVLFGRYNPAGRLPVTFPRTIEDLPPFEDYSMSGRTYRFSQLSPLFPFGFGLSYTRFSCKSITLSAERLEVGQSLHVRVVMENVGDRDGDEVLQLYLVREQADADDSRHDLRGFERIHVPRGARREARFVLSPRDLSRVDRDGNRAVMPGTYRVTVGGSQPDPRSIELSGQAPLEAEFELEGEAIELNP